LVEDGCRVEDVEGVAVGKLHAREGSLLGHDLVDVGVEEGVCVEEVLAKRSLDGRLKLLLGRRLDSAMRLARA
jgi:hypothetical protein